MALLKDGAVATDTYTDVSAAETVPATGDIIVGVDQWQSRREELTARQTRLGIRLNSDEKPQLIKDDLGHFDLIALDFPTFRDGRGYSYARLLRERYSYQGELRAVGDVLMEQLHFMHRVGFNSFALADDDAAQAWAVAASDITVWYQPTEDGRPTALQQRHGRQ